MSVNFAERNLKHVWSDINMQDTPSTPSTTGATFSTIASPHQGSSLSSALNSASSSDLLVLNNGNSASDENLSNINNVSGKKNGNSTSASTLPFLNSIQAPATQQRLESIGSSAQNATPMNLITNATTTNNNNNATVVNIAALPATNMNLGCSIHGHSSAAGRRPVYYLHEMQHYSLEDVQGALKKKIDKDTKAQYGPLDDVKVGEVFENLMDVVLLKIHCDSVNTVCTNGDNAKPASSAIVYDGEEHDDRGNIVTFVGEKIMFDPVLDKEPMLTGSNLSLSRNSQLKIPIRLVRAANRYGSHTGNQYAPHHGLRYDGVYFVKDYWFEKSTSGLSQEYVYVFNFLRVYGQPALVNTVNGLPFSRRELLMEAALQKDTPAVNNNNNNSSSSSSGSSSNSSSAAQSNSMDFSFSQLKSQPSINNNNNGNANANIQEFSFKRVSAAFDNAQQSPSRSAMNNGNGNQNNISQVPLKPQAMYNNNANSSNNNNNNNNGGGLLQQSQGLLPAMNLGSLVSQMSQAKPVSANFNQQTPQQQQPQQPQAPQQNNNMYHQNMNNNGNQKQQGGQHHPSAFSNYNNMYQQQHHHQQQQHNNSNSSFNNNNNNNNGVNNSFNNNNSLSAAASSTLSSFNDVKNGQLSHDMVKQMLNDLKFKNKTHNTRIQDFSSKLEFLSGGPNNGSNIGGSGHLGNGSNDIKLDTHFLGPSAATTSRSKKFYWNLNSDDASAPPRAKRAKYASSNYNNNNNGNGMANRNGANNNMSAPMGALSMTSNGNGMNNNAGDNGNSKGVSNNNHAGKHQDMEANDDCVDVEGGEDDDDDGEYRDDDDDVIDDDEDDIEPEERNGNGSNMMDSQVLQQQQQSSLQQQQR